MPDLKPTPTTVQAPPTSTAAPASPSPTVIDTRALVNDLMARVKEEAAHGPSDPVAEELLKLVREVHTSQKLIVDRWNGLMDMMGTMHRDIQGLKEK